MDTAVGDVVVVVVVVAFAVAMAVVAVVGSLSVTRMTEMPNIWNSNSSGSEDSVKRQTWLDPKVLVKDGDTLNKSKKSSNKGKMLQSKSRAHKSM